MSTLLEDVRSSAEWVANALSSSGYQADFSIESLKEIDRFFDEQSRDGKAMPGGLLSQGLGSRIFSVGAYVGEVIIRNHGGEWQADNNDPDGEMNVTVVLPRGGKIWPVKRVMKRIKNGPEDGIYSYGRVVKEYDDR